MNKNMQKHQEKWYVTLMYPSSKQRTLFIKD